MTEHATKKILNLREQAKEMISAGIELHQVLELISEAYTLGYGEGFDRGWDSALEKADESIKRLSKD